MDANNHQVTHAPMSLRIIVVDISSNSAGWTGRVIKTGPGWPVVATCRSAAHAIEVVAAEPVDLVVLDLRMPEMSGLDLICRLRANRPELALIVLTADISDEDSRRGIALSRQWHPPEGASSDCAPRCIRAISAGGSSFIDQRLSPRARADPQA